MAAPPAWFFSTLAQAVAAIIGLSIAFTVTSYFNRRTYIQDRTDKFRERLLRYSVKHQGIMDNMARAVKEQSSFDDQDVRFDLANRDVDEWAQEQAEPQSARLWANLSGVGDILSDVDPALGPDLEREEMGTLHNAADELVSILTRQSNTVQEVYKEITNRDELPDDYYTEDILDDHRRVEAWLSRNLTEKYENQIGTRPGDMPLSGQNFYSWVQLFEEFRLDTKILSGRTPATELTDFMAPKFAARVVLTSVGLAIVGIFLPIMFLISSPDATLPLYVSRQIPDLPSWPVDWGVYLVQIALLAVSGYLTFKLFGLMFSQLRHRPATTMAELLGPEQEEDERE